MNDTGIGSDVYKVVAGCTNCWHWGFITGKRGEKITGKHECPNCGCKTFLKKSEM